jgi:hypothetical protein
LSAGQDAIKDITIIAGQPPPNHFDSAAAKGVAPPLVSLPRRHDEYSDPLDAALVEAIDGLAGQWTQLELIDMDVAFRAAMRRAHPELCASPSNACTDPRPS